MKKFIFTFLLMIISYASFGFESGRYTGETDDAICSLNILQLETSFQMDPFACDLKDGTFGVSFGREKPFDFGDYSFTYETSDGSIVKAHVVANEKLLSYKIYDEEETLLFTLILTSSGLKRAHLIITNPFTTNEEWIDMDLIKKD